MKHLAISKWLIQLGLPEYSVLFDDEYDGVEDLLHLTELDLQQLGVHNRMHRVHILSSIQVLQERERRRELKMMAEGKFASLPRNMHMGRQCSLASSMDLLSTRPAVAQLPPSGYHSGYHSVSIHGTLPRKKKGGGPVHPWDVNSHTGSLPHPGRSRLPSSPLIHNIMEEHLPFHTETEGQSSYSSRDQCGMDPTMEYVKRLECWEL
ncbi:hypothetical protein SKAU_G00070330 [Synaphobranchus kaupii]|uniref:SAM domain-containing protein n=1 Tax=Synaphobranchus kaupii TaxID=118154 RepID=A0A9Q1G7I8_SYNKA|nr:hypothetical protein SKAU_G00070330 [Synaphobranchus kaupii]